MNEIELLEEIGFTKGEIKVYFALLEAGTNTTGPIIAKSKIARSKVYDILEKLKEKGLVSELIRNNMKYFQALSPIKILDYLNMNEAKIREKKNAFRKILPQLIEKQGSLESEQQIKVYHGFEGLKTLYLEMTNKLGKNDEYLGFSFPYESLQHKPVLRLIDNFHKIRAERGARAKILCTKHDTLNASKLKYPKDKFYEYKISKHHFPPSISIFQDTVATFIWGKTPKVFVIISQETANHYRKFFYELWGAD